MMRIQSLDELPVALRDRIAAPLQRELAKLSNRPKHHWRRADEEHVEQVRFFKTIDDLAQVDPAFRLAAGRTFAVPNGGARSKRTAGRLKAEGVRSGISDIFVALPSAQYYGLFLEMKSLTGSPSAKQSDWLRDSDALGYASACCRGADAALVTWCEYVLHDYRSPLLVSEAAAARARMPRAGRSTHQHEPHPCGTM